MQARNRPRRNQPAAAGGQSDFLQFLERLNEDIFCETLLPMLIQDASAGNLAATCSQLRKLCHSSVKGLKLRPLLCSDEQPSIAGDWTHNLQEHFPHCRAVAMQVHDKESYHAVNYVLPALARWATGLCVVGRMHLQLVHIECMSGLMADWPSFTACNSAGPLDAGLTEACTSRLSEDTRQLSERWSCMYCYSGPMKRADSPVHFLRWGSVLLLHSTAEGQQVATIQARAEQQALHAHMYTTIPCGCSDPSPRLGTDVLVCA